MERRLHLAIRDEVIAAWNRRDPEGILAPMADDVIFRDVAVGAPHLGRAALREAIVRFLAAFPDVHVEITSTTADGTRIAQEWTMTGTHLGDFMGVAATGRWTKTYGATVTVFDDDGRVVEASMYWNPLVMLRQLGVEPRVAAAPA